MNFRFKRCGKFAWTLFGQRMRGIFDNFYFYQDNPSENQSNWTKGRKHYCFWAKMGGIPKGKSGECSVFATQIIFCSLWSWKIINKVII